MSLILLNLESNQLIKLDNDNPFIIGRGNVQGCFDKRVSRNHGRITCTIDGKIRLAALHCNPCFFTRNGVPPIQQINKNEEETLNEGDYLGLLPNAFWFKVTTDKETNIKKEPDELSEIKTEINCDETIQTNVSNESSSASNSQGKENEINKDSQCMSSDSQNDAAPVNPEPASSSSGFGTADFEKTRRLPLWMYDIDEPTDSNKRPKKHPNTNSNDTTRKKQKFLTETGVKKETNKELIDEAVVKEEVNEFNVPSTSRGGDVENSPEHSPVCHTEAETSTQAEAKAKKEGYESDVDTSEAASRPLCQYEGNCYRKNPQHKLEFCHPGDADYVPYEERPLCPYGGACYRRNEKHKVEFRHPPPGSSSHNVSPPSSGSRGSRASSPLPAKRRRKKVKRDNPDFGDDEYDLEDPFINDDTSDEYVPSDLDDQEEDLDTSRGDD